MKPYIDMTVDLEVGAGDVRYRELREGEHIARSRRIDQDVILDLDADGQLLGIELLALDERALGVARAFAEQNGYTFPRSVIAHATVPA